MTGKEKCKILKEIRAQIAAANEIAWVTEECPHKGECRGTCPKCEAEVRKLERELERRRARGKMVVLEGLLKGMIETTADSKQPNVWLVEPTEGDPVPTEDIANDWVYDNDTEFPKPVELDGQIAAPDWDDDWL